MGLVSEVLSVHCRKPIFGYKAMIYSILAIGFLAFIVWAHHMFMAGVNPFISNFFVIFTLIIAVPSAVKVFNWITTLYGGNIRFTSAMLFGMGFVSMFIFGWPDWYFPWQLRAGYSFARYVFRCGALPYRDGYRSIFSECLLGFINGSRKCLAVL